MACRTTKRHKDMVSTALRLAVLLLLGYAQCTAAVGSDGGLGVKTDERMTSATATAFSGIHVPHQDGHAVSGLSGTVTFDPSVHAEINPFRDGMPSHGRRLLHGCHGKRSAAKNIYIKCGPSGLIPGIVVGVTQTLAHGCPAHAFGACTRSSSVLTYQFRVSCCTQNAL